MPPGDATKARALATVRTAEQLLQGRVFGPTGVLESDGFHVRCHICGEWFVALGPHIFQAHGTRAREYKIAFGLMQKTPLMSQELIDVRRKWAREQGAGDGGKALAEWRGEGNHSTRIVPTSEEERPIRDQAHQKIKVSHRRRNIKQGRRVLAVCDQCGASVERQRHAVGEKVYCSHRCHALATGLGKGGTWRGKKHSEETKRRLSEQRKGPEVTATCPNCGVEFTRPIHRWARCCSKECSAEYRRNRHPHGTIQSYRSGKCRCPECRAANADYHLRWKRGELKSVR